MTAIHDSSPQHQTIQAHVVEEIMPDQLTEVTDVKEVINQLLPTRKRKPRVKKPTGKQHLKYSCPFIKKVKNCKSMYLWKNQYFAYLSLKIAYT